MGRAKDLDKNNRIRQTFMQTKARRLGQDCRVYTVKVQTNKLNTAQRDFLKMAFVEAKWLYNHVLSLSQQGTDIFHLDYTDIATVTHYTKDKQSVDSPLIHLSSQMKQDVLKGILTNIKALAKSKEKGNNVGELKFLSEYQSINLKQAGSTYQITGGNRIRIQGLKKPLKVNGLEQLAGLEDYELANAKLIQKPSGWYVALTVYTQKKPQTTTKQKLGIDLGCQTTLTTSDGRKYTALVEESERLKRLQRKLQRAKKGSNNRWKLRKAIQKCYEHETNKRNDAAHKLCHLLSEYQIVMQDEQLKAWKRRHGKKVQHGILGRVKQILMSRSDTFVLSMWIPTTKQCTRCGHKHETLTQRDRVFVCPHCGYTEDRDVHAAQNMLWFEENIIGVERTEYKLADFKGHMSVFFGSSTQEAANSSDSR